MARVVVPASAATVRSERASTPSAAIVRSAASSSASAVVTSCSRCRPTVDKISQHRYGNSVTKSAVIPEDAMAPAIDSVTGLAYDDEGGGPAVVFLHGVTFDRRSWAPIIERLDGCVRSLAIDLPAHGVSGGAPASLDDVAAQVHQLIGSLMVDRPIVVGHSMSGGIASFYATAYPSRGVVTIDNGPDIRPFAQLVQQLEPALC